jgi:hypothetical protein
MGKGMPTHHVNRAGADAVGRCHRRRTRLWWRWWGGDELDQCGDGVGCSTATATAIQVINWETPTYACMLRRSARSDDRRRFYLAPPMATRP